MNSDSPSTPANPPTLADLQFLLGQWQVPSQPGEPTGGFNFEAQLSGLVILRRNYAEYPASPERLAFRHEDLMVIYKDGDLGLRADYFDNEGHVIHYTGQPGQTGEVNFVSPASPQSPGFRLTYRLVEPGVLTGAFEIAPPGQASAFSPYLSWSAHRVE